MRTVAILPVKSFGRAKQRLTGAFPDRPALAAAMVADVLAALARVPALDELIVVTAEPTAAEAARAAGARVVEDPVEAGQSQAAALGIDSTRADRALLVPGDCPALDPAEVGALLEHAAPVVIVPDRHGQGTNALLLTPPDVMAPAFGEGSFARHAARARAAGADVKVADVPSLELDVDTPDDLAALRRALAARPGGAARTRALLEAAAVA
ncbi:MAG TPA: 2-phospho-L-lactate guanylyltransferase [Solirubrobacter sp.]|nr:2-phospho-L-lactate guanylyltransferase [Solirubrobacter sp.]